MSKQMQIWKCNRCKEYINMELKKCGCETSPSPWYPVEEYTNVGRVESTTLLGCSVKLFVWDGTLEHAKNNLPTLKWVTVSKQPNSLLRFPCEIGNGSVPKGGWILLFEGQVADYGFGLTTKQTNSNNTVIERLTDALKRHIAACPNCHGTELFKVGTSDGKGETQICIACKEASQVINSIKSDK